MRRHATLLLAIAAAATLGVAGGTAFAGASSPNGAAKSSARVVPHFSTGTAVKVKAAAVVNADGTLARGSTLPYKVTGSSNLAPGQYEVDISHSVAACAYVATLGEPAASSVPGGEITVATRAGNNSAVFVLTDDSTGTHTNEPFHLVVVC
jgi:hypothetical protein